MSPFSESELRRIVKEGCTEALTAVGIDTKNPHESQADMAHLRRHRQGCEAVKKHTMKTVCGVVIPAALYALWEGVIKK